MMLVIERMLWLQWEANKVLTLALQVHASLN